MSDLASYETTDDGVNDNRLELTLHEMSHMTTDYETLDKNDELASFRTRFHIPRGVDKKAVHYFCGNSLGLQPLAAQDAIRQEMDDWSHLGVEGHVHATHPWFSYHSAFPELLAPLVGAKPIEVVAMNSLTVNLHLMLTSFYRPTADRHTVIMAGKDFPSDRFAIESQIRLHGYDPEQAMIEVQPLPGTHVLTTEQILAAIEEHKDSVALVMFSGVHFLTGQFFDLEKITHAGHAAGACVGIDLAHAIGNVEMRLHDWNVDFAVWCSYKYLNSGPGGVGGAFVHEVHAERNDLPRLAGWWGHDEATRFEIERSFNAMPGANGWQLSNAQVFSLAVHRTALEIFSEARMDRISAKRDRLTSFAERTIDDALKHTDTARIITPRDSRQRGAQLSVAFDRGGREVFEGLIADRMIVDWRTPNIIRIAPAPLYTSYADVAAFGDSFGQLVKKYL